MNLEHTKNGETANLAYQLWEQAGRPTQRDLEFWLEAEKRLARRSVAAPANAAAVAAAPKVEVRPAVAAQVAVATPVVSTPVASRPSNRKSRRSARG